MLHTGTRAERVDRGHLRLRRGGESLEVLRVVTLPRLVGRAIPGLPGDAEASWSPTQHGRVTGVPDVYAAGDITAFPVKQGGLACQQADAAADHIAARAGAKLVPQPFHPVIHGVLMTERASRFMRGEPGHDSRIAGHPLWWPPTKIAGRELAGYLEGIDEERDTVQGVPVDLRDRGRRHGRDRGSQPPLSHACSAAARTRRQRAPVTHRPRRPNRFSGETRGRAAVVPGGPAARASAQRR